MRAFLLSFILGLGLASSAFADVAYNGSGVDSTAVSSMTEITLPTYTVGAGSNLCLLVSLQGADTMGGLPTVTWDFGGSAQDVPRIGNLTNTTRLHVFRLSDPAPGNLLLKATWASTQTVAIAAVSFSGAANPCTANEATYTNSVGTVSPSFAVTSSDAAGLTVAFYSAGAGKSISSTDSQIQALRSNATFPRAISYSLVGALANTHSWTLAATSTLNVGLGYEVVPFVATTRPCSGKMTLLGAGC